MHHEQIFENADPDLSCQSGRCFRNGGAVTSCETSLLNRQYPAVFFAPQAETPMPQQRIKRLPGIYPLPLARDFAFLAQAESLCHRGL